MPYQHQLTIKGKLGMLWREFAEWGVNAASHQVAYVDRKSLARLLSDHGFDEQYVEITVRTATEETPDATD